MRFLLYGDIVTDGSRFKNKMYDILTWRNHVGIHSIINHRYSNFSLFYSNDDSFVLKDCRRLVFSGSIYRLLQNLDLHDVYKTRSYYVSFRRIYLSTPLQLRLSILLFHGFLQSALQSFMFEFQTHRSESIHPRYDYLTALCIFCSTILSERVLFSFNIAFHHRKPRRIIAIRLKWLLYSFIASIFSEVEERDFHFWLQFLETQRPYAKGLVSSLFRSIVGRKRSHIHSHAHLQRLAAVLRKPGSKNFSTRFFS